MATAGPEVEFKRVPSKSDLIMYALENPDALAAEICNRDFTEFIREFWEIVGQGQELQWNWHLDYLAEQLMKVAEQVAAGKPSDYDLVINIPPGTTKSTEVSVMFPAYCWTKWPWMRFMCASYSSPLSLDHADKCRNIVKSEKYQKYWPHISIDPNNDSKSDFRLLIKEPNGATTIGGGRISTSVGGTATGFHAHIIIIDDPLNPREAVSPIKLNTSNDFLDQTLSTRKIDKEVTTTILIMQRLHEGDPTGHILAKKDKKVRHICLPGEIFNYSKFVKPVELILNYQNGYLDPRRLNQAALDKLKADLGEWGYAGQVGQNPVPPGGAMFTVDRFVIIDKMPAEVNLEPPLRYWDKAGTEGGFGARTAGVKMRRNSANGKYIVVDCKAGRWGTDEREEIIRDTTEGDGYECKQVIEQEPGSGGKDSALATIKNLAGYSVTADRPTGDKIFRADPWSVQVNNGNVQLLRGEWNHDYIEEHRFFPFGVTKDKVDASSGAFKEVSKKRLVRNLLPSRENR